MKRLFIAIKIIPSPLLLEVTNNIRATLVHEKINWVNMNNLHLTLKFLGETREEKIPFLITAIQQTCNQVLSFSLHVNQVGIFGSRYNPKVIWVGIEKNPYLDNIVKTLFNSLEPLGWHRDRQNFVPHLTLGRIKQIENKQIFQNAIATYRNTSFQHQSVQEIILYESILRPSGTEYHSLFKQVLSPQEIL